MFRHPGASLIHVIFLSASHAVGAEPGMAPQLAAQKEPPATPNQSSAQFVWSGGVTCNTATIKAKMNQDGAIVRAAVSRYSDHAAPQYSTWDTASSTESNRFVTLDVHGLSSGQQYFYVLEVNGTLDTAASGKFRAFPEGADSFTLAFASCASTGSNHAVFETIRAHAPLFFLHTGDFHYQNIAVNDRDTYRAAYETVLASPGQSRLFRECPIVYMWDDHDYGPNNSDSTAPGRGAARLTYQEYVPHYPLAAGTGNVPIYSSFSVGRVFFIVCDSRSARSPWAASDDTAKTMLGRPQKEWFKQQLVYGRTNYELIVWINTLPWIGQTGDDGWHLYTNERRELADFIKESGITNLCMLSGDAHMLAIDDGTNSDYASAGRAGFPVMHAAALDRSGSVKGGPYSHGAFPGSGQFGLMTVIDRGDSIHVVWSGRNHLDRELVGLTFAYPARMPVGVLDEAESSDAPERSGLSRTYPNPFNSTTTIEFFLASRSPVMLTLHNILGQRIRTLQEMRLAAGAHAVIWDGTDDFGRPVATGVYFPRLQVDGVATAKKVVILR